MNKKNTMTLQDIIEDIHALTEDVGVYERKYGILSETFYESYMLGEEPEDDSWVLDWSDWAGAYKILLRRQDQYRRTIKAFLPCDDHPGRSAGRLIFDRESRKI